MKSNAFLFSVILIGVVTGVYFIFSSKEDAKKYDPLVLIEFKKGVNSYLNTRVLKHRFKGTYTISLSTDSPLHIGSDYKKKKLDFKITLKLEDKEVFSEVITRHIYPYWGNQTSGVSLLNYEVPSDLPSDAELLINVEFGDLGREYLEEYQFNKLIISKVSDE